MKRCKYGKLKKPIPTTNGGMRYCKLKKKTKKGRSRDRKKKSKEYHEKRYRKYKRTGRW